MMLSRLGKRLGASLLCPNQSFTPTNQPNRLISGGSLISPDFTKTIPLSKAGRPSSFPPSSSSSSSLPQHRWLSETQEVNSYVEKKAQKDAKRVIQNTQEYRQRSNFEKMLVGGSCPPFHSPHTLKSSGMTGEELKTIITAGLTSFHLHCESRFAAAVGEGFYTIGPCGEELLSAVGIALDPTDATALHYRHLATQIAKSMRNGMSLEEIVLNRARGSCISTLDPVTGGAHCALGGGPNDFYVTSTLSSQAPQALGRALGSQVCATLQIPCRLPPDAINYVSIGDGSVNNGHFLSAHNMAQYAKFRGFKCPLVFAISDNNLSISLPGYGWLNKWIKTTTLQTFEADGNDCLDIFVKSRQAITYSRDHKAPSLFRIKNLVRRFGHAASDRQDQYLTPSTIADVEAYNPLYGACALAVNEGVMSYGDLIALYYHIQGKVENAFAVASQEPKLTERKELRDRLVAKEATQKEIYESSKQVGGVDFPPPPPPPSPVALSEGGETEYWEGGQERVREQKEKMKGEGGGKKGWLRKHMTSVFHELLDTKADTLYFGEDVQHGGYYLVTEGLYFKHPFRVTDFPPDETSIIGAAIGLSQMGVLPIAEIPYAKYVDCGYDQLTEAAIMHWVSLGKFKNGMILRLQGFGPGLFGGNYHTHNALHLLPGMDVVCYSNGLDYARGMRNAYHQAKNGRVVMSVDCTQLLNLRNLHQPGDDLWMREYPSIEQTIPFDFVRKHGEGDELAIVTYGTGVITCLQAKKELEEAHNLKVSVIDSPYLSSPAPSLVSVLGEHKRVLFADICKVGQHPFASISLDIKRKGVLDGRPWDVIGAEPTYNPLGQLTTFLSKEDVVEASLGLFK